MNINVSEKDRIVEIWLTNAQKQDKIFRESLKPLFAQYKAKKYTVAVFCSGDADLTEKTADLLIHNKAIISQKDAEEAIAV